MFHRLALILLMLALLSVPVLAAETVYQNDDLGDNFAGKATLLKLAQGEVYAVTVTPPSLDFPVTLLALEFVFVNSCNCEPGNLCTNIDPVCKNVTDPSKRPPDCGQFHVLIWKDSGAKEPGDLLFSTEQTIEPTPIEIPGTANQKQRINLSDLGLSNLLITEGRIRIGLKAADPKCVLTSNTSGSFPVLMTDGGIQSGRNWVFGSGGGANAWFDASKVGVGGDFVLRLVAETSNVTTNPDSDADVFTPQPDATDGTVVVTSISPSWGYTDEETSISVIGTGFVTGVKARLGSTELTVKSVVGSTLINALVPAGLTVGKHTLELVNPDNSSTSKTDAFEARLRPTTADSSPADTVTPDSVADSSGEQTRLSGGSGSCSARIGRGAGGEVVVWLLLLSLLVATGLRRRTMA